MAMKPEINGLIYPTINPPNSGEWTVWRLNLDTDEITGEVRAYAGYHFVKWEFYLETGSGRPATGSVALQSQLYAQVANPSFHVAPTYIDSEADALRLGANVYFAPNSSPDQQVSGIVAMAVDENGMFGGGKVQIDNGAKNIIVSAVVNAGTLYELNAEADQGYMFMKWVSQYGTTYYTNSVTVIAVSGQPSCTWMAYFVKKESGTGKILRRASNGVILRSATSGMMLRKGTAQASQ